MQTLSSLTIIENIYGDLNMQSTSILNCSSCCNTIPKQFYSKLSSKKILNSKSLKAEWSNYSFLTLTATNSCSKERERKQTGYPDQESRKLFQDFNTYVETRKHRFREGEEELGFVIDSDSDISTNMWWANLKAALGQRINLEGIACSIGFLSKDKQLTIPHLSVPDIRYIDWAELKKSGFKGVVFDKDNTITVPYSLSLWEPLVSSIEQCKTLFGDNIAVFSNSAGLTEYDPDGRETRALEDAIGIKVIRHRVKKPAGSADEIEQQFGCDSSSLIMVGDRPFTDIVYGNRNGFFTILTEPLSLAEETLIVKKVRLVEVALVKRWSGMGLKMTSHSLVPDSVKFVKDVTL